MKSLLDEILYSLDDGFASVQDILSSPDEPPNGDSDGEEEAQNVINEGIKDILGLISAFHKPDDNGEEESQNALVEEAKKAWAQAFGGHNSGDNGEGPNISQRAGASPDAPDFQPTVTDNPSREISEQEKELTESVKAGNPPSLDIMRSEKELTEREEDWEEEADRHTRRNPFSGRAYKAEILAGQERFEEMLGEEELEKLRNRYPLNEDNNLERGYIGYSLDGDGNPEFIYGNDVPIPVHENAMYLAMVEMGEFERVKQKQNASIGQGTFEPSEKTQEELAEEREKAHWEHVARQQGYKSADHMLAAREGPLETWTKEALKAGIELPVSAATGLGLITSEFIEANENIFESLGLGSNYTSSEDFRKAVLENYSEYQEWIDNALITDHIDETEKKWIHQGVFLLSFMGIAAGAARFGVSALQTSAGLAGLESLADARQVYLAARENGYSEEEASNRASQYIAIGTIVGALLNRFTFGREASATSAFASTLKQSQVKFTRLVLETGTESVEEVSRLIASNAAAGQETTLPELFETMETTAIITLFTKAGVNLSGIPRKADIDHLLKRVDKSTAAKIRAIQKEADALQRGLTDIATGKKSIGDPGSLGFGLGGFGELGGGRSEVADKARSDATAKAAAVHTTQEYARSLFGEGPVTEMAGLRSDRVRLEDAEATHDGETYSVFGTYGSGVNHVLKVEASGGTYLVTAGNKSGAIAALRGLKGKNPAFKEAQVVDNFSMVGNKVLTTKEGKEITKAVEKLERGEQPEFSSKKVENAALQLAARERKIAELNKATAGAIDRAQAHVGGEPQSPEEKERNRESRDREIRAQSQAEMLGNASESDVAQASRRNNEQFLQVMESVAEESYRDRVNVKVAESKEGISKRLDTKTADAILARHEDAKLKFAKQYEESRIAWDVEQKGETVTWAKAEATLSEEAKKIYTKMVDTAKRDANVKFDLFKRGLKAGKKIERDAAKALHEILRNYAAVALPRAEYLKRDVRSMLYKDTPQTLRQAEAAFDAITKLGGKHRAKVIANINKKAEKKGLAQGRINPEVLFESFVGKEEYIVELQTKLHEQFARATPGKESVPGGKQQLYDAAIARMHGLLNETYLVEKKKRMSQAGELAMREFKRKSAELERRSREVIKAALSGERAVLSNMRQNARVVGDYIKNELEFYKWQGRTKEAEIKSNDIMKLLRDFTALESSIVDLNKSGITEADYVKKEQETFGKINKIVSDVRKISDRSESLKLRRALRDRFDSVKLEREVGGKSKTNPKFSREGYKLLLKAKEYLKYGPDDIILESRRIEEESVAAEKRVNEKEEALRIAESNVVGETAESARAIEQYEKAEAEYNKAVNELLELGLQSQALNAFANAPGMDVPGLNYAVRAFDELKEKTLETRNIEKNAKAMTIADEKETLLKQLAGFGELTGVAGYKWLDIKRAFKDKFGEVNDLIDSVRKNSRIKKGLEENLLSEEDGGVRTRLQMKIRGLNKEMALDLERLEEIDKDGKKARMIKIAKRRNYELDGSDKVSAEVLNALFGEGGWQRAIWRGWTPRVHQRESETFLKEFFPKRRTRLTLWMKNFFANGQDAIGNLEGLSKVLEYGAEDNPITRGWGKRYRDAEAREQELKDETTAIMKEEALRAYDQREGSRGNQSGLSRRDIALARKAHDRDATEEIVIEARDLAGNKIEHVFTQHEMAYVLAAYDHLGGKNMSEATRKRFREYSDEALDKMRDVVSDRAMSYTNGLINKFFPAIYEVANATHRRLYGYDLERISGYLPIATESINTVDTFKEEQRRAGITNEEFMKPSALHARNPSATAEIVKASIVDLALHHQRKMIHFTSYAEVHEYFRKVFLNSSENIKLFGGEKVYKQIEAFLETLTIESEAVGHVIAVVDKLRRRFVQAKLGVSISQIAKQSTASVAVFGEMTMKDIASTTAHIAGMLKTKVGRKAFLEEIAYILKSPWYSRRYDKGFMVEYTERGRVRKSNQTNRVFEKEDFLDKSLWTTRAGDKVSVLISGMPLYFNVLRKGLKKGKNALAARKDALDALSYFVESNLQGAGKGRLDALQRSGSIGRTVGLFMSQNLQYWRNVAKHAIAITEGKAGKAKAMKKLAISGFGANWFFIAISTAFQADWEDYVEEAGTNVFGYNAITYSIAQTVWDLMASKGWAQDASGAYGTLGGIVNDYYDAIKGFVDVAKKIFDEENIFDGFEKMMTGEFFDEGTVRDIGEVFSGVSSMVGVPFDRLAQYYEAVSILIDQADVEINAFQRAGLMVGLTPYALGIKWNKYRPWEKQLAEHIFGQEKRKAAKKKIEERKKGRKEKTSGTTTGSGKHVPVVGDGREFTISDDKRGGTISGGREFTISGGREFTISDD